MKNKRTTASLGISTCVFVGASLLTGLLAAVEYSRFPIRSSFIFLLASAFLFLAILQILNRLAGHFPSFLSRVIHWVHAMIFEGFAIVAALFLHPVAYFSRGKSMEGSRAGRPILLVHGYLHDSSAWVYHKMRLQNAGFGPVYTLNLGHPFRSIRRYAEKISALADQIEKETKRKDLTLIGHSMGGLVSCLYATEIASSGKVKEVITLGSPLGGTIMAQIGIGPNAREMERNSELAKNLGPAILKSKQTRYYQIATKTDQLVIPHASALFGSFPDRQLLMNDIGHVALLFSPRVADQIQSWLKRA